MAVRSVGECVRQGLTIVHFSPQPELFLTLKSPNASQEKCLR